MCDFRPPPTGVLNKESGEIQPIKYCGGVAFKRKMCLYGTKYYEDCTDIGCYSVAATGSYYTYFDGEDFFHNAGPPNKYELLFDPNAPEHFCGMLLNEKGDLIWGPIDENPSNSF